MEDGAPADRGGDRRFAAEIGAAAAALREARDTLVPCAPIRDMLPMGANEATAYAIQAENTALAVKAGRRIVGRKIGLTAKAVQRQLGVSSPDYGMLFADMCLADEESIMPGQVLQPKLEAEVALVLERDLAIEQPTLADLIRAVAYALPSIEIVGSRIADWNIGLIDTIADNASSGLFVLGGPPRRLAGLDLRDCRMQMTRRNNADAPASVVSEGRGSDCLGNPLNAAVWLARKMVEMATPLQAGDIIMTGALGQMVPFKPGDHVEATLSDLGSVRTSFSQP